jgi:hypothetical protein
LLALDWRKAFDSINPEGLLDALRRFGLPEHFLTVVASIYTDRTFQVKECGVSSDKRKQRAGICQGCPLSPFLFIAVMTVLMHDSYKALDNQQRGILYDVLYADDTLIIGANAEDVEELAAAIEQAGAQYGMSLHWGKTQGLSVCTNQRLKRPDGSSIDDKGSLLYLGGLISSDGRMDSELSRRIGFASHEFRNLRRIWSHASLSRKRKLEYFQAFVVSKLIYGLSTAWLVKMQQRRLDGFYARCLRRVLGIPAAYVSRISNKSVFDMAEVRPLTAQVRKQQICLLGRVGRSAAGSPLRRDTFVDNTLQPQVGRCVRRVGRPRQDWTSMVLAEAEQQCGGRQSAMWRKFFE